MCMLVLATLSLIGCVWSHVLTGTLHYQRGVTLAPLLGNPQPSQNLETLTCKLCWVFIGGTQRGQIGKCHFG